MSIFIGCDPGTSNYGYTILDVVNTATFDVTILEIGMFPDTISNLTDKAVKPPKSKRRKSRPDERELPFIEQFQAFSDEWEEVFAIYSDCIRVIMERFQTRGIKGKSIEAVSMMNGALCRQAEEEGIDYEVITAATWKNQVNRYITLTDCYEFALPPHSVDSCFIGIHGALSHFGRKWAEVSFAPIVKQLQSFSL